MADTLNLKHMGEAIEDRLRRAAHDLQMKQAPSRSTSNSGRTLAQASSEQTTQNSHFTHAKVPKVPSAQKRHVAKRTWQKIAVATAVAALLGVGLYSLFGQSDGLSPSDIDANPKLPAAIISQISDFVPYFFRSAPPQGFTFSAKDVNYSAGVLFFQVQDKTGHVVVISEQALPNDFANSKPHGDRAVSNLDGNGTISNRDGRTIGTLITSKTPRTLIDINAAETVNASTVEALMTLLVPLSNDH